MKQNLEVHFWGFQGQKRDYSPCIWNVDVLKNSSFKGRLPHDNRSYKDVIPKGLSWRFDSSESEFAITCLQMIQLKERPQDFFAGTLVFPRGTSVTDDQLRQLQSQVTKAVEVLTRVVTTMRPDEMGPIHGEARDVAPRELLKTSHECIILPLDSGFTLGGMVKKLTELHHNQLTVLLLDPTNGEPASQEEMQTVIRVAASSHPEATISIAANLEEVQQEDTHQYQELLNERAEKQRLAEEKRQQEDARLAKEARRREEEKRQRQARKTRTLALLKTAAKGLAVLAILGGIGVGGYLIKEKIQRKSLSSGDSGNPDNGVNKEFIDTQGLEDSVVVREFNWSTGGGLIDKTFLFDTIHWEQNKKIKCDVPKLPSEVSVFYQQSDSSINGIVVQLQTDSNSFETIDTLTLNRSDLPELLFQSFRVVLNKTTSITSEDAEKLTDRKEASQRIEGDSAAMDSSKRTENTP